MGIIIDSVRIKNFRSLQNIEVQLKPITLLVGANNAGKTSFLRALSLALHADRRSVTQDDLFIDAQGVMCADKMISIDIKFIPSDNEKKFDEEWSAKFGNGIQNDNVTGDEFYAYRTLIDFSLNNQEAYPPLKGNNHVHPGKNPGKLFFRH